MSVRKRLGFNGALVLQALSDGEAYGFDVMRATDLPSGTVYPLLRRLEKAALVCSTWEEEKVARAEGRPARRYYRITADGVAVLAEARRRIRAQQSAVFGPPPANAPGE